MVDGAPTILANRAEEAEHLPAQKSAYLLRETILLSIEQALRKPLLCRRRDRSGQARYPCPHVLRAYSETYLKRLQSRAKTWFPNKLLEQ